MSAADPNAELWFTRHQQALDPALKARDARLRHSVTRDVAAACVEARTTAEWRVDTGKTIARHRIDVRWHILSLPFRFYAALHWRGARRLRRASQC